MKKILLLILAFSLPISAFAFMGKIVQDLKIVKGYYSNGNKCILVTPKYMKKISYCRYKPPTNDTFRYECFFVGTASQSIVMPSNYIPSDYIYDTNKECRQAIELEKANGGY
jgi:hypothetical protein